MNERERDLLFTKAIQDTRDHINASGASPSLDTLDLYLLMGRIGNVMRDAGSRKKIETLSMLREMSEELLATGEPKEIAKGLLIGAFAATCFDFSKLQ